MGEQNAPRYLPRDLAERLRFMLGDAMCRHLGHGDGLWKLDRLLEEVYAVGYRDGHGRGYNAGWESGRVVADPDRAAALERLVTDIAAVWDAQSAAHKAELERSDPDLERVLVAAFEFIDTDARAGGS